MKRCNKKVHKNLRIANCARKATMSNGSDNRCDEHTDSDFWTAGYTGFYTIKKLS